MVITPMKSPSAIKNAITKKKFTKRETNTCHTFVKKVSTQSHRHYLTSCPLVLVAHWLQFSENLKNDLKSRFWLKIFTTCQMLKSKKKHRVKLWLKKFTTRPILVWKKYNAKDFELKNFRNVIFWKIVCIQKIMFWFFLLRENDIFYIFRAFSKIISIILHCNFHYVLDSDLKKYNASGFEMKFFGLVRFWIKNLTRCQILK